MNPDSGYGSGGFSYYAGGVVDFRLDGTSPAYLIMVTTGGKIAVWYGGGPEQLLSTTAKNI